MSEDNGFIISAIHNRAGFIVTSAAVDDDVHQVLVTVMDFLRIGEVGVDFVVLVGKRSGHDGRAEFPDDVGDDGLVGDAYADGFLLALENAWNVVVGLQNEGERAGQVAFHQLEHVVVDGFGELAQHTEVVEDKGKIGLFFSDALQLADAFQGLGIVDAAAQAVKGVGGEDDHAAVGQAFQNHLDVTWVGVRWIEFEYHGVAKNRAKLVKCCSP